MVLIEDRASGTQLIQELINEGLRVVKPFAPEGDKTMRMNAQTATIENGFVHLPHEASWLADYLLEVTTFPSAKYDDQADSTSQALAWINLAPPRPIVYAYYDQENALSLQQQGHSIEAIAVQLSSSPNQVRQLISDYHARSVSQESEDTILAYCARCGKPIHYNTNYNRQGELYFHVECFRKFTSGM